MPELVGDSWRDWLAYAEEDRREAEGAFGRGSWREVCSHSQQACEKLLKAAMLKKGIFLPTHDLAMMAEECDVKSATLREGLAKLTKHYYSSRYPDAARRLGVKYDEATASECLEVMRELWDILRPTLES